MNTDSQRRLIKFLMVGGLGTVTNLTIFFLLVDVIHFNHLVIAVVAFLISMAQNYMLNHMWTFTDFTLDTNPTIRGLLKFMTVSTGGLIVNLFLLMSVIAVFDPPVKVIAQAVAILGGTVVNYFGSRYWVFFRE